MNRRSKKLVPVLMAVSVLMTASVLMPVTSFGYIEDPADPSQKDMTVAELNGYSQEQWDALSDNRLEYTEIRERLKNFNPDLASGWDTYTSSLNGLVDSKHALSDARKKSDDIVAAYKLLPDSPEKTALLAVAKAGRDAVSSAESSIGNTIDVMDNDNKNSYNRTLKNAEDSLTEAVQSLVIAYKTVGAQKESLQTLTQLYKESYDAKAELVGQGMATSAELVEAQADMLSAQKNSSELAAAEDALYRKILVLCGYGENDQVEIGDVPSPDFSAISTYDPDADLEKAVGNNTEIAAAMDTDHRHTDTAVALWENNVEAKKKTLHANLVSVYNSVLSAKQQLDGAQAGYQGAEAAKQLAEKQFELGMTTKAQYLGQTITYVQKKAAYEAARLGLIQAMLTYESAVNGNCSTE